MNLLFGISYVALCGLVVLHWTMLRALVRDTLALRRLLEPPVVENTPAEQALGATIASFSVPLLDATESVTESDLRGRTTFLLFVDAVETSQTAAQLFLAVLHTFWSTYQPSFYVVCVGAAGPCRRLRDRHGLQDEHGNGIRILLDTNRRLAARFSVAASPSGVIIDPSCRITKVGGLQTQHDERVLDLSSVTG